MTSNTPLSRSRSARSHDPYQRPSYLDSEQPLFAGRQRTRVGSPGSLSSVSSGGSEPSLNIPKSWGSKARRNNDWLSRIKSDSPVDWVAAAADVALPAPDEGLSHLSRSKSATPSSISRQNTSLDKIKQWEIEEEFTARSLQFSTSPPIKPKNRNTSLDVLREREIETLKDQALTTNRLGEIRERSSKENLTPDADGFEAELPHPERDVERPSPKLNRSTREDSMMGSPARRRKQSADSPKPSVNQGDAIPNSPIVVYKDRSRGNEAGGEARRSDHDRQSLGKTTTPATRPGAVRQDSRDILRRLSRASSATPSPKQLTDPLPGKSNGDVEHPQKAPDAVLPPKAESSPGKSKVTSSPRKSNTTATRPKIVENEDGTPVVEDTPVPKKTPSIPIGGWVNTPTAQTKPRPRSSSRPRTTKPASALPTTTTSSSHNNPTPKIKLPVLPPFRSVSDSTLDSLDLASPASTTTALTTHANPDTTTTTTDPLLFHDAHGLPLSAPQRSRLLQQLADERMSATLRRTHLSIRESKRGIEGLETIVDGLVPPGIATGELAKHAHHRNATAACPSCGLPLACSHWHLRSPFPTTYVWQEGSLAPRPTLFGLLALFLFAWYCSEWILCEIYCHPQTLLLPPRCNGFGDGPNAMKPPRMTYHYLETFHPWTVRPEASDAPWFVVGAWWAWEWTLGAVFGREAGWVGLG